MDNKFNVESSSKAFLWSMFLPQILSLVLIMILSMFFGDVKEMQSSFAYIIPMMLVAQGSFAIIYFWFSKRNGVQIKYAFKKSITSVKTSNVLLCVAVSIVAIAGLMHFVGLFDNLWAKLGYVAGESYIPNDNFGWFLLNVLVSCLIPAVLEELVFRAVIYKGLRRLGVLPAAIISAVMFMLVHLSLGSIVYPLIMGIVFAFVLEKTGNVLYTIIIHFCNNFIIKFIEYINNITGANFGALTISAWWHYVFVVLGAILAIVAIYFVVKYLLVGKNDKLQPAKESYAAEQKNTNEQQNADVSLDDAHKQSQILFQNRRQNIYLWGSIVVGVIFWLIIIISGLV